VQNAFFLLIFSGLRPETHSLFAKREAKTLIRSFKPPRIFVYTQITHEPSRNAVVGERLCPLPPGGDTAPLLQKFNFTINN
jgi:hypothetical protein